MKTGTTASPRRYEAGPASRPNRRMHIAHLARAENELLASAPSRRVRAWAPRPAAVCKIELENCVECASFPAPTPRDEGELHALARQVGCCVRRCDRGGGKSAPAGAGNWEIFCAAGSDCSHSRRPPVRLEVRKHPDQSRRRRSVLPREVCAVSLGTGVVELCLLPLTALRTSAVPVPCNFRPVQGCST